MRTLTVITFLTICCKVCAAEPDLVVADFEASDYQGWKSEGKAFGDRPATGAHKGQMPVTGFKGKGLVNSFLGGDCATGTLTSPAFKLECDYLNFLIGGGKFDGQTCINLLVEGKVVRTATGPNEQSGGSEALAAVHWSVKEFKGQEVVLQIVDAATGGWGHINIDHIVQSNIKLGTDCKDIPTADQVRELAITKNYLLFPISNSAKVCRMTIEIDGRIIHDFDINLSAEKPEWWARLDLPSFVGKTAKITAHNVAHDNNGLALIESSDEIRHSQPIFREALRPQLRFSQLQGWNNDPNGMVYHDGEYHLFWQSNPFGSKWGNMYWGHAVSKDLLHWEELPYALYPRVMAKSHCFSGSAHVDTNNTGGWGKNAMVAAFTDTGAGETLAVSTDKGRTWDYIRENPIIPKRDGRDPKLIWYEPSQHWVIAVYTRVSERDCVEFYSSTDLKKWTKTGQIEGYFECPELFELPVDGDASKKRWVLTAANAEYAIGAFDGKNFTPEHTGKHKVHYGSFYAAQCFSRVPGGRVIQVGWARMELPNMPFNQAFSLPIELKLKSTKDGVRMLANPIKELETLREPATLQRGTVSAQKSLRVETTTQLLDVVAEIEPGDAKEVKLTFGTSNLVYNVEKQTLDDMPLPLVNKAFRVRVVVDRPMYEVIGGEGAVYKTAQRNDGGKPIDAVVVTAVGGTATVNALTVYPLNSIWQKSK